MSLDFESEGLLDGLTDEASRRARLELLERLAADGVPLEELRRAVAEDRLALLPVERVLAGDGPRYSVRDLAERTGLEIGFLDEVWRALGLALSDHDEPLWGDDDLEAAQTLARFIEAGLPAEGLIEITRVLGRAMHSVAGAVRDVVGQALFQPGDTELDLALRWAGATRDLAPQMNPLLAYVLNVQRREQARHEVVRAVELAEGRLPGTRWTVVCFADLVGFTRLGEQLEPDELGAVAGRLEEQAFQLAAPPVRLVKSIGDAVMFVSTDADALLDAALTLLECGESDGGDLPRLRIGLAAGEAVRRAADWYGRPVNLASRLTSYARPGSVLATKEVRDAAALDYQWSHVGQRKLKGIAEEVRLFRVRPSAGAEEAPEGAGIVPPRD